MIVYTWSFGTLHLKLLTTTILNQPINSLTITLLLSLLPLQNRINNHLSIIHLRIYILRLLLMIKTISFDAFSVGWIDLIFILITAF